LSFNDPNLKKPFKLPMVHIRIKHGNISFQTVALIDSGATANFMPSDFIGMLNLDPKEQDMAVGAGGTFRVYKEKIDSIQIIKGGQSFCDLNGQTVSFPFGTGSIPYAVLGRDGIFMNYDIVFREPKKHVMFKNPKFKKR